MGVTLGWGFLFLFLAPRDCTTDASSHPRPPGLSPAITRSIFATKDSMNCGCRRSCWRCGRPEADTAPPGPLPSVFAPVALTVTVTSLHQRRSSRERRRCRGAGGPRLPLSIMHLMKVCQACSTRGSNAASWATRHALDPLIVAAEQGFCAFHPQATTSAPTVVALAIVLVCAAASEPFVLRTRCVPAFAQDPILRGAKGGRERRRCFPSPTILSSLLSSVHLFLGKRVCRVAWLLPHSCPGPTIVNLTATDSLSIMAHNAKYDTNMDWCVLRSTADLCCGGCSSSSGWCAGTCPKRGGSFARETRAHVVSIRRCVRCAYGLALGFCMIPLFYSRQQQQLCHYRQPWRLGYPERHCVLHRVRL